MRILRTYIGLNFNVKADKCCVFCKNCEDMFFDCSGPYLIFCKTQNEHAEQHNKDGTCEQFEDIEERHCESCTHKKPNGCETWDCKFERKVESEVQQ